MIGEHSKNSFRDKISWILTASRQKLFKRSSGYYSNFLTSPRSKPEHLSSKAVFRPLSSGITLLIAVVILSSAMSIALGIAYIVLVEFNINGTAQESYEAFYSADFGKECALFYHSGNADPLLTRLDSYWDPSNPCFDGGSCSGLISCGDANSAVSHLTDLGGVPCTTEVGCVHTYDMAINSVSATHRSCSTIKVVSTVIVGGGFTTLIESHGFNTRGTVLAGNLQCDFSSASVNRSIEACDAPPGQSC